MKYWIACLIILGIVTVGYVAHGDEVSVDNGYEMLTLKQPSLPKGGVSLCKMEPIAIYLMQIGDDGIAVDKKGNVEGRIGKQLEKLHPGYVVVGGWPLDATYLYDGPYYLTIAKLSDTDVPCMLWKKEVK
ncbi:MAG TPA: hypothetical protein ENI27_06365 [bacterium]|nr:hypothetical protein [bacterium]